MSLASLYITTMMTTAGGMRGHCGRSCRVLGDPVGDTVSKSLRIVFAT